MIYVEEIASYVLMLGSAVIGSVALGRVIVNKAGLFRRKKSVSRMDLRHVTRTTINPSTTNNTTHFFSPSISYIEGRKSSHVSHLCESIEPIVRPSVIHSRVAIGKKISFFFEGLQLQ